MRKANLKDGVIKVPVEDLLVSARQGRPQAEDEDQEFNENHVSVHLFDSTISHKLGGPQ